MTQTCSSCKADVPANERYCGACGYDTYKDDRIATELAPKLARARGWILAVGIIYVVSTGLMLAMADGMYSSEEVTFQLVAAGVLCLVHIGLWWWAKTAPFAAAVVALVLFVTLQLVQAVIDPSTLARGVIIKVFFLVALVQAVMAGVEVQRLLRERR